MGRAAGMRSIGVGVGWNSNLICGDMSIQTTLRNPVSYTHLDVYKRQMQDSIRSRR